MQTLQGRTCVFAGAAAGDGIGTVKALCKGGMNVVMMTRKIEAAEKIIGEVQSLGATGKCSYYSGDKGAEFQKSTYNEIAEMYGSVDVIICNTGDDGIRDDIETLQPEVLEKSFSHLAVGSFRMLQAALPWLKRSIAPRVIFMTTVEGCIGGTHESFANAVAKGAVKSLTLNCAARLAGTGITVNCISKGAVLRKDIYSESSPKPHDRLSVIPMGRLGTAEDLAEAICFLACEESSYITGQIIELSGGLNLGR